MKKQVLILSEAIGNGHTKAGEALMQGISHLSPSVHTQVLEVGQALHPITTNLIVNSYIKMIVHFPSLWRKIYFKTHNKPFSNWKKYVIHQLIHRHIEALLENEKPHLIVCTHPFTSSTASRLKKMGHKFTLCTMVTDFYVHGAWAHSEVDFYMVSNKDVYKQLIEMGIPEHRIVVTGMPINSNFCVRKNKQELRKKLNLKDIPTLMIMGGGLGLGGMRQLAHALLKWKEKIQVIICTGNNRALRSSFLKDERFHHPNIRILGFVDVIDEWMEATDFLITKPGGLTCFEALATGIPLYIYQPIPGHEEKNCDFLVNNELATKIDDIESINNIFEKLFDSSQEMDCLDKKRSEFQKGIDPLAGADFIVKHLKGNNTGLG
ncbi:MGDG synthase family glycosyltransferase [Jeotgalibacillus marinus]|uniref:Glycosyltransferase n=1 Tax=Jeotgalibacillus marinus TaxID=86667 RepID=A0ABV3Q662_9BACL